MSIRFVFWFLMLLCLISFFWSHWPLDWKVAHLPLMEFVLFGLLGWKVFGPPVQG